MDKKTQASLRRSLAARITAWTTNLLATAVIVLLALLLGGKLLALWRTAPSPPDDTEAAAGRAFRFADDPRLPVELHFGRSQFVTHRQVVAGGRQDVVRQLSESCAALLEDAEPAPGAINSDEQRLLKHIAAQSPVLQPQGGAAVYQLPRGFPMVVGTRRVASPDAPAEGQLVVPRRVVAWGVAVPRREQGWTLYTFHRPALADAADHGQQELAAVDFPLPPAARRLLAIVVPEGETITAFQGSSTPGSWAEFYSGWFADQGWTTAVTWQQQDGTWYARFERRSTVAHRRVDIQLFPAKGTFPDTGTPTSRSQSFQGLLSETVTPIVAGGD